MCVYVCVESVKCTRLGHANNVSKLLVAGLDDNCRAAQGLLRAWTFGEEISGGSRPQFFHFLPQLHSAARKLTQKLKGSQHFLSANQTAVSIKNHNGQSVLSDENSHFKDYPNKEFPILCSAFQIKNFILLH